MLTALLKTKLHIPTAREKRVARPHLFARLEQGLDCKLILVSTPAGFGKTCLLADWLRDQPAHVRVRWLALDERDNNIETFLQYLAAALQAADPNLGDAARMLADVNSSPALVTPFLTETLNRLATEENETLLVLDDFHFISNPAIHEAVEFLLEHAPDRFHLALLTRVDPPLPLTRLRSRGQMVELRAEDLRFSISEAADFLNQVMGLDIPAGGVAELEQRTEGWVAGLQMAALSMRNRGDVTGFINAFTGSHRFIMDYLTDEVLDRQPESVRDFLLETSILDQLSGPLCEAVTDRTDSQSMLEQLETANLFLIPLDDERGWYRYHHLFADLLQNRLRQSRPEKISELHRKASLWHQENNFVERALQHAAAIPDENQVAAILEEQAVALIDFGYVRLVEHWLQTLPVQMLTHNPVLALCTSVCAHHIPPRDLQRSHEWLRTAEAALVGYQASPERLRELRESIAANRVNLARMGDDLPESILALIAEILTNFPEISPKRLAFIHYNAASAHFQLHDLAAAGQSLARIQALGLLEDDPYDTLAGLSKQIDLAFKQGDLIKAEQLCLTELRREQYTGKDIPAYGLVEINYGELLLTRGELEQAKGFLQSGYRRLAATAEIAVQARALLNLTRLAIYQGAWTEACQCIEKIRSLQSNFVHPAKLLYWLHKSEIEPSSLDKVECLLTEQAFLPDAKTDLPGVLLREERRFFNQLMQANARIVLFRAKRVPDIDVIQPFLETQTGYARTHSWAIRLAQLLAVRALAYQALGERAQALDASVEALSLTIPCSCVGIYPDFGAPFKELLRSVGSAVPSLKAHVDGILAITEPPASPTPKPVRASELVEPLTNREQDVLRLMAAGLSNPEIGQELYLSLNTVKTHVRGIYGKLGVNNRTQAANRARELGLV